MTKGNSTRVISARISDQLYERIKFLAMKRKETINDWVKRIIKASAQWKE